jgi:hypothetical protein
MVTLTAPLIAPLIVFTADATGFPAGMSGTWVVVSVLVFLCWLPVLLRSVRDRVRPLIKEIRGDQTNTTAASTRPDSEPGQPGAGG